MIMMGKPTVAGTRITVELVLEKLAAGETVEQILAAHPRLTLESIRAAIAFAAQVPGAEVVYPMEPAHDQSVLTRSLQAGRIDGLLTRTSEI